MLPRSCRRPTQAVIGDPADVLAGTLMPDARSSVTASFRSRLSASRSFPDRPGANLLRFGRAAPICGAHRWQRATHPWSARCVLMSFFTFPGVSSASSRCSRLITWIR